MGNKFGSDKQEAADSVSELPRYEVPEQFKKRTRRVSVSAESDREQMDKFVPNVIPKSLDQLERIRNAVGSSFLFSSLDKLSLQQVVDAMAEKKVQPDETIIKQGDPGDYFYVIETGSYEVFKTVSDEERKVFSYNGKGTFGELALMYNCPRAATVKAATEGTLWALERAVFQFIVIQGMAKKRALYESFIEKMPLFVNLTHAERSMIADCLVPETYEDGALIVRQGDVGDKFYLIERGQVIALQHHSDLNEDVVVGNMTEGQYFGERALITKQPRAATVRAVGEVQLAVMDRASFERLLGDCRDVMQRHIERYEDAHQVTRRRTLSGLPPATSSSWTMQRAATVPANFSALPASNSNNELIPSAAVPHHMPIDARSSERRPSVGEVSLGDQDLVEASKEAASADHHANDDKPLSSV